MLVKTAAMKGALFIVIIFISSTIKSKSIKTEKSTIPGFIQYNEYEGIPSNFEDVLLIADLAPTKKGEPNSYKKKGKYKKITWPKTTFTTVITTKKIWTLLDEEGKKWTYSQKENIIDLSKITPPDTSNSSKVSQGKSNNTSHVDLTLRKSKSFICSKCGPTT